MGPTQDPLPMGSPRSDIGPSTNKRLRLIVAFLALACLFLFSGIGLVLHLKETAELRAQVAELRAQLADEKALRFAAEAELARVNERRVRDVLGETEGELEVARKRIIALEKELADEKAEKEKVKKALDEAFRVQEALEEVVQRRDAELTNERRNRGDPAKVAALQSQLSAAQDELKRVQEEIRKFKGDSSPSKDLSNFISKVGQPKTNSGYLDEHICADRGLPPGCTKPKPAESAPSLNK